MKNCILGYIINECGVVMEDVEVIATVTPALQKAADFKIHNPDRVIGMGCLQTANEKNRNGRIYKREDLMREINSTRTQELLNAGQLCGESGHPIGGEAQSLARQQTVIPDRTCVRFLKIWMEGDSVRAYFEGTNNSKGETFDKDLRIGVRPAFSLRALGTVKSTPEGAVVENLKMITYDYVIFPSHPGAYTTGVLAESAVSSSIRSNFALTESMDATRSFVKEFKDNGVLQRITNKCLKESVANYVMDESANFQKLKNSMDISKYDTIDVVSPRKISLTEAGKSTIVLDIEDYIAREIQNYF